MVDVEERVVEERWYGGRYSMNLEAQILRSGACGANALNIPFWVNTLFANETVIIYVAILKLNTNNVIICLFF